MAEHTYPQSPRRPEDVTAENPFTIPGFFSALADDRLLGGHCEACNQSMVPPRPACYACGSRDVTIEEQAREGTVVSYTTIHRPPSAFTERAPFVLGIIELASGARVTGRINASEDAVAIGDDVRLVIENPTAAERDSELPYEADWPIHAFTVAESH